MPKRPSRRGRERAGRGAGGLKAGSQPAALTRGAAAAGRQRRAGSGVRSPPVRSAPPLLSLQRAASESRSPFRLRRRRRRVVRPRLTSPQELKRGAEPLYRRAPPAGEGDEEGSWRCSLQSGGGGSGRQRGAMVRAGGGDKSSRAGEDQRAIWYTSTGPGGSSAGSPFSRGCWRGVGARKRLSAKSGGKAAWHNG